MANRYTRIFDAGGLVIYVQEWPATRGQVCCNMEPHFLLALLGVCREADSVDDARQLVLERVLILLAVHTFTWGQP